MGNTNAELEQKIIKLEQKIAKYEQSKLPSTGQYEGQLWYDSVNKQLKAWDGKDFVNIGGSSSGGKAKALYFTKLASGGTGIVNYTGFGFNPTAIIIDAWYTGGATDLPRISHCFYIGGVSGGYYQYLSSQVSTRMIIIFDSLGVNKTRALFSSFINDGFSLDFQDSSVNIAFTVTAFA